MLGGGVFKGSVPETALARAHRLGARTYLPEVPTWTSRPGALTPQQTAGRFRAAHAVLAPLWEQRPHGHSSPFTTAAKDAVEVLRELAGMWDGVRERRTRILRDASHLMPTRGWTGGPRPALPLPGSGGADRRAGALR